MVREQYFTIASCSEGRTYKDDEESCSTKAFYEGIRHSTRHGLQKPTSVMRGLEDLCSMVIAPPIWEAPEA